MMTVPLDDAMMQRVGISHQSLKKLARRSRSSIASLETLTREESRSLSEIHRDI